jgi:hypothetical protein
MSSTPPAGASIMPPWEKPCPPSVTHDPKLKVLNSLTREKNHFMTMDGTNRITWYMYVYQDKEKSLSLIHLLTTIILFFAS